MQEEEERLQELAAELDATAKELADGRAKLQADLDIALRTSEANDTLKAELVQREGQLDAHESQLKEWRQSIKEDVAAQVAEQEAVLQVRLHVLDHSLSLSLSGHSRLACRSM